MRVRLLDESGTTHIRCWYDIGQLIRTNGTVRTLKKSIAREFNLHAESIGFEVEGFDLLDNAMLVNILRDEDIIRLKHFKSGPLKRLVNAATSLFRPSKQQDLKRKPSVSTHLKAITSGLGKRKRQQGDTMVHKRIKAEEEHFKYEHDIESDDEVDSDTNDKDILENPYGLDPDFEQLKDETEYVSQDEDYQPPLAGLSRSLSLPHPPRHNMQSHPRSSSAVESLPAAHYQEDESEEEEESDEEVDSEEEDSAAESSQGTSASSALDSISSNEEDSEDSEDLEEDSEDSNSVSQSDSEAPIPQKNQKRHTLSLPQQKPPGEGKASTRARNARKRRKLTARRQSAQSSSADSQEVKIEEEIISKAKEVHQQLNIHPTSADLANKKKKKTFLKGQSERVGQHFVFDEEESRAQDQAQDQSQNTQPSNSSVSAVISAVELEDLRHAPPQVGPEMNLTLDRYWKTASSVDSFKKRVRKLASMDAFQDSPEEEEIVMEESELAPSIYFSQSKIEQEGTKTERGDSASQRFLPLTSKDGKHTRLAVPLDPKIFYFDPSESEFLKVQDRSDKIFLPDEENTIAFKTFELGPNYTPRMSDFKIGIVESVVDDTNLENIIYTIKLVHESYKAHREQLTFDRDGRIAGGKFEMTDNSATTEEEDDMKLTLTWKEMHEVHLKV